MPLTRPKAHHVRRLAIAAGIVAAVLLAGYVGGLPAFAGRVPVLAASYRTWSGSTHAEVGCSACHARPGNLSQASFRAVVLGESAASLVDSSKGRSAFFSPSNEACLVCHSDLRTVSPKGDLQIPHRAHVTVLEMRCVECHAYLVHDKSPEGKHVPPMAACLKCHDGDTAKDDCGACHTAKAAPETHRTADWLVVHGQASLGQDCDRCHKWASRWCADCHSQRPKSHGNDWRQVHGARVAEHRNCEACHAGSFCTKCHGTVPQLKFDPALRLVE